MKLRSSLLTLLLIGLVSSVLSQPKKRDTLMWFVAHWQSKTVFKADSNYVNGGAVNTTITAPQNGAPPVIQSQQGKQLNQQIDQAISQTQNLEDQVKQNIQPEGFNEYHLYTYSKEAMDTVAVQFESLKVPTTPQSTPPPGQVEAQAAANFVQAMTQSCQQNQAAYNNIIQCWQANRHNRNEQFNYEQPPQADYFNCWGCNRPDQKSFDKACKLYDSTFFEPEGTMIRKALSMMNQMAVLGMDGQSTATGSNDNFQQTVNQLFNHSTKNPSGNGPCGYMSYGDLAQAVNYLVLRCQQKADQLYSDVKKQKNYNSYVPAIMIELAASRQVALMGLSETKPENQVLSDCQYLVNDLLDKMLGQAVGQHDMTYLSDIPFMLSLLRQSEMLGSSSGSDNDQKFHKIMNLLTFDLTLELNVKASFNSGQVTQTAHIKGTGKMVVELDSTACVRLVLSKTEKNGLFSGQLLENSMQLPQCTPNYIGTRTYTLQSPALILHFCSQGGGDTLSIPSWQPYPAGSGTWQPTCGTTAPATNINSLDNYFMDPTTMMQSAQAVKSNAGAYQAQMQQMMAYAKQMQSQIQSQMGTGGTNSATAGASIKSVMDMNNNAAPMDLMKMGRVNIPLTMVSNSAMPINQQINAKTFNTYSKLTQNLEYGTLTIQLKQSTGSGQ